MPQGWSQKNVRGPKISDIVKGCEEGSWSIKLKTLKVKTYIYSFLNTG